MADFTTTCVRQIFIMTPKTINGMVFSPSIRHLGTPTEQALICGYILEYEDSEVCPGLEGVGWDDSHYSFWGLKQRGKF